MSSIDIPKHGFWKYLTKCVLVEEALGGWLVGWWRVIKETDTEGRALAGCSTLRAYQVCYIGLGAVFCCGGMVLVLC